MKRYLITGASRGIGRAIAIRLAQKESHLILHGRDRDALEDTAQLAQEKGADARIIVADMSKTLGIVNFVSGIKEDHLDGLVINAGIAIVKPIEELTLEEWQVTVSVNITAPFLVIQKLLPLLKEGSSIVNILSVAARTGFANWSSYCMSKFALEGFSQSLREELRPRGIRVINVYPSATATGIWDEVPGDWPKDKMLPPEETAEAVAYALSRPAYVLVENISVGSIGGNL